MNNEKEILDLFKVYNNTIFLTKYKAIVKTLNNVDCLEDANNEDNYFLTEYFCINDDELEKLQSNYIDKHKLVSLYSTIEMDPMGLTWMDGITLTSDDYSKEILEIASFGSKEAYEASLQDNQDAYLLELEERISLLELGV